MNVQPEIVLKIFKKNTPHLFFMGYDFTKKTIVILKSPFKFQFYTLDTIGFDLELHPKKGLTKY